MVTPPLKLWHTLYTLELIYRDVFNSQLNERYLGKRDQYQQLARQAEERLMQAGIGIALEPLPQPGPPSITAVTGSLAEGTYSVTTSWVGGSGDEGACAPATTVTVAAGTGLVVAPGPAPAAATGWNVYAGTAAENMRRQNGATLGTGTTWRQSAMPSSDGGAPGNGQTPSYLRPAPRILQRG